MRYFVDENSIVRQIWGKSDTVLFIFAGASAEFALNKAVDWLYYTGKLPADPLGRLFSTVAYAKAIVFAPEKEAHVAINRIRLIHESVEENRGSKIPDWAYRDVLYMLIYYSIKSFEILERELTDLEKEEVYRLFRKVGEGMGVVNLPQNYNTWLQDREIHIMEDLSYSHYTANLFNQYRKHLGWLRFTLLVEVQKLLIPVKVRQLLKYRSLSWLKPAIFAYKMSRWIALDGLLKSALLPAQYKEEIRALDVRTA